VLFGTDIHTATGDHIMKTLTILAIALTASVIGAAHAASPNPPTAVVRYDDLDISSTRGSAALLRRLQGAARLVCSDFAPNGGTDEPLAFRVTLPALHEECMQRAIDGAVAMVNRPEFSAYVAAVKAPKTEYSQIAKR
jgi:UrcA family protein